MGFLKKLFKRKPGGTFVGNLLRGVGVNPTPVPGANVGSQNTGIAGPINQSQTTTPAEGGKLKNFAMKWGPWIGGALALVGLLYVTMSGNSGSRRRRR